MSVQHIGEIIWKAMPDGPEKYQAYLCSREWAERRNAVMKRANFLCERCGGNTVNVVHHLTYAGKYNERLEDLQGICNGCHEFIHGKTDVDPLAMRINAMLRERPLVFPQPEHEQLGDWTTICCPFCKCDCCHINAPSHDRSSPDGNQGRITIQMACECGHAWDIVFAGDQGTLRACIRNGRELSIEEFFGNA